MSSSNFLSRFVLVATGLCSVPGAYANVLVSFDAGVAPPGPFGCCGVVFTSPDVDPIGGLPPVQFTTRRYRSGGAWITTGLANRVVPGFTGTPTLHLNNICVQPNILALLPAGAAAVEFDYRDNGGSINLVVNGARVVRGGFPGAYAFPGVAVNVVVTAAGIGYEEGHVQILSVGAPLNNVQIGGQELEIDDVIID